MNLMIPIGSLFIPDTEPYRRFFLSFSPFLLRKLSFFNVEALYVPGLGVYDQKDLFLLEPMQRLPPPKSDRHSLFFLSKSFF